MKRFILALGLLFLSYSAFAQYNPNTVPVPITQLPQGNPAQAGDQIHAARCNYAGCDYSITAASIAALGQGGYFHEQDVTSGTIATVAQVGTLVLVNSPATGAKTITIPASTGSRQLITIMDFFDNAFTYPITAVPVSGLPIVGLNQVYTNGGSITLVDTSLGWVSI